MPDEKFPETPESKAFALAVERRNAAAAALMLAALSGSMQRKRMVREAADQYLYAMRAELRARAAWLKSGPAPSEPHAPKEPTLPPGEFAGSPGDSLLVAEAPGRGVGDDGSLPLAVDSRRRASDVAPVVGANRVVTAADADRPLAVVEPADSDDKSERPLAPVGAVDLLDGRGAPAEGTSVGFLDIGVVRNGGQDGSSSLPSSGEADSRTRTGDLRFTNPQPSATDQAQGTRAAEVDPELVASLDELVGEVHALRAELAQAKDAAAQGKTRVAALVDYAAHLVGELRRASVRFAAIAADTCETRPDIEAAAMQGAEAIGLRLDTLDVALCEKLAPSVDARKLTLVELTDLPNVQPQVDPLEEFHAAEEKGGAA